MSQESFTNGIGIYNPNNISFTYSECWVTRTPWSVFPFLFSSSSRTLSFPDETWCRVHSSSGDLVSQQEEFRSRLLDIREAVEREFMNWKRSYDDTLFFQLINFYVGLDLQRKASVCRYRYTMSNNVLKLTYPCSCMSYQKWWSSKICFMFYFCLRPYVTRKQQLLEFKMWNIRFVRTTLKIYKWVTSFSFVNSWVWKNHCRTCQNVFLYWLSR